MAKIITIVNNKGGVGKTTTSSALGVCLALQGKRVLLIDLDSQMNLTQIFFNDEQIKTLPRTIFNALCEGKDLPIYKVAGEKWMLDFVPSSLSMVQIEKAITLILKDNVKENYILKGLLAPISEEYDYILIDCPPSIGLLPINAMTASNYVLIPMTPDSLASLGLRTILEAIKLVRNGLNTNLLLMGIVLCKYDHRRKLDQFVVNNLKESNMFVFNTKIRNCIEIAESPAYRQNLIDYDSESRGAEDYKLLTNEILELINK